MVKCAGLISPTRLARLSPHSCLPTVCSPDGCCHQVPCYRVSLKAKEKKKSSSWFQTVWKKIHIWKPIWTKRQTASFRIRLVSCHLSPKSPDFSQTSLRLVWNKDILNCWIIAKLHKKPADMLFLCFMQGLVGEKHFSNRSNHKEVTKLYENLLKRFG